MLAAVRAGAPRSTVYVGSSLAGAGAAGRDSFGTGLVVPLAGSAALLSGRGFATGAGVGVGSGACSWAGAGRRPGRAWPDRGLVVVAVAAPLPAPVLARCWPRCWPFAPVLPLEPARLASAPVGLEVVRPRLVDAARIPLVLVVHLFDQPLVGAEIGGRELGLATWGLRHGLIRLFRYVHGECQSSRLDPRTSKCRPRGGFAAWCATSHSPGVADFLSDRHRDGEFRGMWQRSRRAPWGVIALVGGRARGAGCSGSDDEPGAGTPTPTASASARRGARPRCRWASSPDGCRRPGARP